VPITRIFKDKRYSFTVYVYLTFIVGKFGKVMEAERIELLTSAAKVFCAWRSKVIHNHGCIDQE
jgi:hypothetical protein